jgi:predicted Co/Zn/Cd cation transporter (cation efflux family)
MPIILTVIFIFAGALAATVIGGKKWSPFWGIVCGVATGIFLWCVASFWWLYWFANYQN